jgi:transposase
MKDKRDSQLQEKNLPVPMNKALKSLKEHWEGLTVFVDHPEVPMDNNKAERLVRTPVIARNNFNGACAKWSGNLAAMLFSIFKTIELFKLNPRTWLTAYLTACAENKGRAIDDIQNFLPWNMSADQLKAFSTPISDSS